MKSLELFTGAGGLALGLSHAGFKHVALIERDADACASLRENQRRRVGDMAAWPVKQCGVESFDYRTITEGIELLAAGVPCQPFSIGGKHRGHEDERNMFPQTVDIIRTIKPMAVLIENVRGLTRSSFARYFNYILLMLSYPEIRRKSSEEWSDHFARLERYHTRGRSEGLHYRVVARVLNAADYGVPQKRERVFIVGFRGDLGLEWSFPPPTHSSDSLLWEQFHSGDYWRRHSVSRRFAPKANSSILTRIDKLRGGLLPLQKPWVTVRDVISDLSRPSKKRELEEPGLNHFFIPGARRYVGHTGSPLDEPAKTLKAGDHGVPGGENMLLESDGSVRYFTIRESARLQTFPDEYVFPGSWTESMRQIGNAVPIALATHLAKDIRARLKERTANSAAS
ncbi:MAG: DNA cytosine methyltransferase [Terriglobales bacterium]